MLSSPSAVLIDGVRVRSSALLSGLAAGVAGVEDRADPGDRLAAGETLQRIPGLLGVLPGPRHPGREISQATTGVLNDVPLHIAMPLSRRCSPTSGGSLHT